MDRGRAGCEVVCIMYMFMLLLPNCVFLNRGNHEARAQNSWMGFEDEVFAKYDTPEHPSYARVLFNTFSSSFDALALATLVQDKIFICHGGLVGKPNVTLDVIDRVQRRKEPPLEGNGDDHK